MHQRLPGVHIIVMCIYPFLSVCDVSINVFQILPVGITGAGTAGRGRASAAPPWTVAAKVITCSVARASLEEVCAQNWNFDAPKLDVPETLFHYPAQIMHRSFNGDLTTLKNPGTGPMKPCPQNLN